MIGDYGRKGIPRSQKTKDKISKSLLGRYKGCESPHWKGGIAINYAGYILVYKPEHPQSNRHGHVFEHRLIMEKKLNRYLLPTEIVHHMNHIKDDNRIENLLLISSSCEHAKIHSKGKGNPNYKDGKYVKIN